MVKVNAPTGTFAGLADASVGYGLRSVTVALAEATGKPTLVAVTVTVPLLGMADGGVYRPPTLMVPGEPRAPAGSAIDQVTVVGLVLVTLAEN